VLAQVTLVHGFDEAIRLCVVDKELIKIR